MENKAIWTWYKKVNKLISKNIEKVNLSEFSIDVQLTQYELNDNTINAIYMTVYNLANGKCEILFNDEIATFFIDKVNRKALREFKEFLEKLSEDTQN